MRLAKEYVPFTMTDYPDHAAAIFYVADCPMSCWYCRNRRFAESDCPLMDAEDAYMFLERGHDLLTGVAISGGEPLTQPDLAEFCKKVHEFGFDVRVFTNGMYPDRLRALLAAGDVESVSLDIKGSSGFYEQSGGSLATMFESLAVLRASGVAFEVCTTVLPYMRGEDLARAMRAVGEVPLWVLRQMTDAKTGRELVSLGALEDMRKELLDIQPRIEIRTRREKPRM